MIGVGTLGALMMTIASVMPAVPMTSKRQSAQVAHERRKKAERALKKAGRAPVPYADADIIEAAESKRERKAAKAERDMARMKQGRA